MKVINSILQVYAEQRELNEVLKDNVDKLLNEIKDSEWHYVSRLKSEESFALKIETGRFQDPKSLEDFFACTIVVQNYNQIDKARKLLKKYFHVKNRRPKFDTFTTNDPFSFPFDDLRLFVTLKPKGGPKGPIHNTIFEIQIKTFLQHAWSIATHDLIYKSDDISWAKQRIAYQIKAMLEHAELTIQSAEKLRDSPEIFKANKKVRDLLRIKKFLEAQWEKDQLPPDIVRLSKNILYLLNELDLSLNQLIYYLKLETKEGKGIKMVSLSPYMIIIQTLINRAPQSVKRFLNSEVRTRFRLFIPKEIETRGISVGKNAKVVTV